MKSTTILMVLVALVLFTSAAGAGDDPRIGLRAGLGTDINFGIAYGVGGNYLLDTPSGSVEIGVLLFGGSFDESTDEGIHTYDETTDLFVFGAMANYLINYEPDEPGTFYVLGGGLASISAEWEETSATDVSLGTPLPGGGSKQSAEGSAGGMILNFGIGKTFDGGFDVRLEVPTILSFSAPGESAGVIPTIILTAGLRL